MQTKGKVERIYEEHIEVSVIRNGACGENCASCSGCSEKNVLVKAKCYTNVSVGDFVELKSDTKYIYIGLIFVFLFPVLLPLLVYLSLCNTTTILAFVLSAITFIVTLCFLYLVSKSKRFIDKVTPTVVKVISKK